MLTVKTCCGCFTLKTGSYIAAVLFMIRCIFGIVSHGILIGYSLRDELDIINNTIGLFARTLLLIFSIMVITSIRKEKMKTILMFMLVLLYFVVQNCIFLFYKIVYFFCGYNYDILDNFLIRPILICVIAYCLLLVYSFYRQLPNSEEKLNTNDIKIEKQPLPA